MAVVYVHIFLTNSLCLSMKIQLEIWWKTSNLSRMLSHIQKRSYHQFNYFDFPFLRTLSSLHVRHKCCTIFILQVDSNGLIEIIIFHLDDHFLFHTQMKNTGGWDEESVHTHKWYLGFVLFFNDPLLFEYIFMHVQTF